MANQSLARIRVREDGQLERVEPGSDIDVLVFGLSPNVRSKTLATVVNRVSEELDLELEEFRYRSRRFDDLLAEGMIQSVLPTEEQRRGAHLLADKDVRSLATAIKSSGGLLLSETPKQLQKAASPRNIEDLQASGLVGTELVVICTRTSGQVARAASREQLEASAASGITCACGRVLTEERIEEALTVTELGRSLLDGSSWMSTLLLDTLLEFGIPLERILIEQQAAGDEMDCCSDINGQLVFFELKDKEFSLGNAYSFGAKISVLRPNVSVVVTTERVGNDAKEHFQRAQLAERQRTRLRPFEDASSPILYIEGIDKLKDELGGIVSSIYQRDGLRLLQDVLPRAAVEPMSLVRALLPVPEQISE